MKLRATARLTLVDGVMENNDDQVIPNEAEKSPSRVEKKSSKTQ